jgi:hypothetical protein
VTSVADHLSDELLSTLLDAQLGPADEAAALAHLATCSTCTQRLADFRAVSAMLRRLPEIEAPRDFSIGPRGAVAEPSNVIRLQRWYTWSRAAAGSLAAVFVFLVAGTLYVDATRPMSVPQAALAPAPRAEVRTAENQATAPTANTAGAPPPAAAPKPAAQAPAAPAAFQSRAQPTPAPSEALTAADASDQVKAATSVSALATPTSVPLARQTRDVTTAPTDAAAPWRTAASIAGILAALALLIAFAVRHRLRAARTHPTTVQE